MPTPKLLEQRKSAAQTTFNREGKRLWKAQQNLADKLENLESVEKTDRRFIPYEKSVTRAKGEVEGAKKRLAEAQQKLNEAVANAAKAANAGGEKTKAA